MNIPRRFFAGVVMVLFFTVLLYAINLFQVNIDWAREIWRTQTIVPFMNPVGSDFRGGWYEPAKLLRHTGSIGTTVYPPLVTALGLPFTHFQADVAYSIQVVFLYIANILAIALAIFLIQRIFGQLAGFDDAHKPLLLAGFYAIAGLVFFLNVTSYGFLFSIERGNYDVYAIVMALLALVLLMVRPQSIWLQVICLSISAHLKIYPLILFALLFWKHRWKIVLPALTANLVLLFILGPANALTFLTNLANLSAGSFTWVGNHSAAAFAVYLNGIFPGTGGLSLAFKVVPIVLWLAAGAFLWKKGFNGVNPLLLFIISIPVMCTIPDTSHDYTLVILIPALCMILCLLLLSYQKTGNKVDFIFATLIVAEFMIILRAPGAVDPLISNKYPLLLIFEILVCLRIPSLSGSLPTCSAIQKSTQADARAGVDG